MTRPAWHGLRVGDEVRFYRGAHWYRVTRLGRGRGVPIEHRGVEVRLICSLDRRRRSIGLAWITDIAERRRPK